MSKWKLKYTTMRSPHVTGQPVKDLEVADSIDFTFDLPPGASPFLVGLFNKEARQIPLLITNKVPLHSVEDLSVFESMIEHLNQISENIVEGLNEHIARQSPKGPKDPKDWSPGLTVWTTARLWHSPQMSELLGRVLLMEKAPKVEKVQMILFLCGLRSGVLKELFYTDWSVWGIRDSTVTVNIDPDFLTVNPKDQGQK